MVSKYYDKKWLEKFHLIYQQSIKQDIGNKNQRQGDKLINMFDFESEKTKTNSNWGLFETIIG